MNKQACLKNLNQQQKDAVLHTKGPLIVLAGAGSGKTKVITYRFFYLSSILKVPPTSILAMTFTNKAAEEMKERVKKLMGKNLKGLWIGTFHALSNRILRKEIENLGFQRDFAIYDEDDSGNLIRSILKEFRIHEALYKGIASKINSLKASLVGPKEFLTLTSEDSYGFDEKFSRVYVRYQDELKKNNALDFDDLLMYTVKLLEEHPRILNKYNNDLPYIMIDEFQDTNKAQYRLSKLLAGKHKNICAVGDDDQSIYRFRGADVNNLLAFEKDFPKTKVIRLEQNYRSTQNILNAANGIITNNPTRKPKKLWSDRGKGEKIFYCITNNENEEARYIASSIRELYLKGKHSYGDFAVLYRINLQVRVLEDAMRDHGLPYHVIGGISFYKRKEIKDIISYLKVIANPSDSINLKRIINCPPRGIGTTTVTRIENEAKKKDRTLFETMKQIASGNGAATALREKVSDFVKILTELISHHNDDDVSKVLWQLFEKTGYLKWTEEERTANLMELINSAKGKNLQSFIDTASLSSSTDVEHGSDSVSLMTLHSAKGLEFPVVFIAGIEDGLLPHFHALKNPEELQEERRLFYVGMTRAQDLLILSTARKRKLYASVQKQESSRFLSEIPSEYYHCIEKRPKREVLTASVEMPMTFLDSTPFVTGVRVKHPKWGMGVVRDCYGKTDDLKVMVNFSTVGVKRLSLKFADLEKL